MKLRTPQIEKVWNSWAWDAKWWIATEDFWIFSDYPHYQSRAWSHALSSLCGKWWNQSLFVVCINIHLDSKFASGRQMESQEDFGLVWLLAKYQYQWGNCLLQKLIRRIRSRQRKLCLEFIPSYHPLMFINISPNARFNWATHTCYTDCSKI